MAQTRNSKIRVLRRRHRSRLVRVNDQLNTLTWEIFEQNAQFNDVNTSRAVAVLDDALSLIQRAGALLNSVHVEDEPDKPAEPSPQGFISGRDNGENGKGKPAMSRSVSSVN